MNQVTRQQYKQARRLYRDNGRSALKWMQGETSKAMQYLLTGPIDLLQERAELSKYFESHSLPLVIKHDLKEARRLHSPKHLKAYQHARRFAGYTGTYSDYLRLQHEGYKAICARCEVEPHDFDTWLDLNR